MDASAYLLLTSAMRYVFTAAILCILFTIIWHSLSELSELRRVKRWIDAGFARHIEFLPPFNGGESGFLLAKSNLIGRSPRCDICIQDPSVRRRHAWIYEKKGVTYLERCGRAKVWINKNKPAHSISPLADADLVRIGDVEFYFRLKRMPPEREAEE